MELSFTITKDDLYDFNLYHYNHSPIHQRNYKISKYSVPIIYIGYAIYSSLGKELPWLLLGIHLIGGTIFTAAWFLVSKYSVTWQLKSMVKKAYNEKIDKQTLGTQTLSINAEGVSENNEFGESKSSWSAINEIIETDTLILFYFGTDRAYIVPKRSFDSDIKVKEFIQQAKMYQKE